MNVKELIKLLEKYNEHSEVFIYKKGSVYNFPLERVSNDHDRNVIILNGGN